MFPQYTQHPFNIATVEITQDVLLLVWFLLIPSACLQLYVLYCLYSPRNQARFLLKCLLCPHYFCKLNWCNYPIIPWVVALSPASQGHCHILITSREQTALNNTLEETIKKQEKHCLDSQQLIYKQIVIVHKYLAFPIWMIYWKICWVLASTGFSDWHQFWLEYYNFNTSLTKNI